MSEIRHHINILENIENIQEEIYNVVKGDNLTKIAKRKGITLKKLLSLNPELKANPNLIRIGQKIRVPGSMAAKPTMDPVPPAASPMDKISPQKGIGIKAFAKQLGYDNVEEFIAAQKAGGGKIGTMKSGKYAGNNFVFTNQTYIPKAKAPTAPTGGFQKVMAQPKVDTPPATSAKADSMKDIAKTVADMTKAASMVKLGDIQATPAEISAAKKMTPDTKDYPTTDKELEKTIKTARRMDGPDWVQGTKNPLKDK